MKQMLLGTPDGCGRFRVEISRTAYTLQVETASSEAWNIDCRFIGTVLRNSDHATEISCVLSVVQTPS